MKTKIYIMGLVIMAMLNTVAYSQNKPMTRSEKLQTINAQKIAYFTEALQLSTKEAEVFWPVYNEFEKKREALRFEKRAIIKKFEANSATLTDLQVEEMINRIAAIEIEEATLIKEYNTKFKQVLPIQKVLKLYKVSEDFKHHLLKQINSKQN